VTVSLRVAVVLFLVAVVASTPRSSGAAAPDDELPEGEGKKILQAQCTSCHELTEVTKFRGYYNRKQWRDIVVTMVEYGADLKPAEIETVADYLATHLGKQ
jgi:mono/diheme cytochrome c family protein